MVLRLCSVKKCLKPSACIFPCNTQVSSLPYFVEKSKTRIACICVSGYTSGKVDLLPCMCHAPLCVNLYRVFAGFLTEECDDTVIELSKLSLADSEFEVTVLDNFHETSERIATARDYVLRRCNQTDTILFDECYPET